MPLTNLLSIAKTALIANQTALRTTSNNISNINTPGYTRQEVNLTSATPVLEGYKVFGAGVEVAGIKRIYDRFLETQILDATVSQGMQQSRYDSLSRLESIFNDAKGMGLDTPLNEFFNALNDLASDPQGIPPRSVVLAKASALGNRMNLIDSRIRDEIGIINNNISSTVDIVNDLVSRVAEINSRIASLESFGEANDLRDQRSLLIKEISSNIDIFVVEDDTGLTNIMTSQGSSLLTGITQTKLQVTTNADNHGYFDIMAGGFNMTDNIKSGKLRGLLDVRDQNYQKTLEDFERLAASLTSSFNALHKTGFGLDGSTGLNFFKPLAPVARTSERNTGGALAVASVFDTAALTLDDYEIKFIDDTTFNITNTSTGTLLSSGNTYTSGANIDFQGLRFNITDGPAPPLKGDIFTVSTTQNASRYFALSLQDTNQIAAATDSVALPGDNRNVLSMITLTETNLLSQGQNTFNSFYASMTSEIGSATGFAKTNIDAQDVVLGELVNFREAVSGVSMDEEGVNLIKFQHAYEAAAKVITTVDSMFDTIIRMR